MGDRRPRDNDYFDSKLQTLIRCKVRTLAKRYVFARGQHEDLCQDLSLQVVTARQRYDAAKAQPLTFADRVTTRRISDLIAHATAACRDRCRERPLAGGGEDLPLTGPDEQARLESALDVRDAVARLPEDLREIAVLLAEDNEAAVVRRTGLSRERVRGMVRRIRQHFAALGLGPEPRPGKK
jgi:RNA polymerase sigma factor (sigma-70 family)